MKTKFTFGGGVLRTTDQTEDIHVANLNLFSAIYNLLRTQYSLILIMK